jgi:hypothetical protein
MPAGPVHHQWHKSLIPAVVCVAAAGEVVSFLLKEPFIAQASGWFFVWYLLGRYIDPDWDQQGITAAEGRIQRELWPLAPFILSTTTFYASSVYALVKILRVKGAIGGTHRTWLTHSIVPGTLGRMAVICTPLILMVNYATFLLSSYSNTMIVVPTYVAYPFFVGMFLGLGLADFLHIMLDNHYGGE